MSKWRIGRAKATKEEPDLSHRICDACQAPVSYGRGASVEDGGEVWFVHNQKPCNLDANIISTEE